MKILREIFSAASGRLSSKRVCGFIGVISCIILNWYCIINNVEAPEITKTIFLGSCSLIGVDSVTSIWKKNEQGSQESDEDIQ